MIVKMKKAVVFMKTSQKTQALEILRGVGVLHLSPAAAAKEVSSLEELKRAKDQTLLAIALLSDLKKKKNGGTAEFNAAEVAASVAELHGEIARLNEDSARCRAQITALEPWGNFSPEDLKALAAAGLRIRLFWLSEKQLKALPETVSYIVLRKNKKMTAVAVLNEEGEIDGTEQPVPEYSLQHWHCQIEENDRLTAAARAKIESYAGALPALRSRIKTLEAGIEFETVRSGAGSDEEVSWVSGFVPVDTLEALKKGCAENALGLVLTEPDDDDPVPTKIKNGRIVSLIQPLFDFLGTVPGYKEADVNGFVLFFFSVFFAMILGDAGYGLIFLTASVAGMFLTKKKSGKVAPVTVLLTWLSFCVVVWGALSGNWFASQTLAQWAPLKAITVPALDAFGAQSSDSVKFLSFFIGTVQISIAHIWSFIRGLREKPRVKALTDIGWLMACWGLFNLMLNLILKKPMLPVSYGLIGGGVLFLILFGKQDDNHFFKNIGKGLLGIVSTFLNTVNMFSDIMSYIRLFAVGLASFQIELAFSSIAGSLSESLGVPGMIFGAVVLLFGHALNMMLGVLAILVHAVRLNLLEFAGHLGQQWVGIKYRPFENTKTNQE